MRKNHMPGASNTAGERGHSSIGGFRRRAHLASGLASERAMSQTWIVPLGKSRDADAFVEHVERCREHLAAHFRADARGPREVDAALVAQRLAHGFAFVRLC